jgi:hypothetical protein
VVDPQCRCAGRRIFRSNQQSPIVQVLAMYLFKKWDS